MDAICGRGLFGHAVGISRLRPTGRRSPGVPGDDSIVSPQRPAHSSTHRSPRDDPGRAGQASEGCPMAVSPTDLANAIRALSMDAVEAANSGHPGMPMGMADVATVMFTDYLKFDPADPAWPDRDRFVLSAGHGSMLLFSLLHPTG